MEQSRTSITAFLDVVRRMLLQLGKHTHIQDRDGCVDVVYIPRYQKSIRYSSTRETIMETKAHRWTTRETIRMDSKLFER